LKRLAQLRRPSTLPLSHPHTAIIPAVTPAALAQIGPVARFTNLPQAASRP